MLNFEVDTTDRLDKFLASKVEVSRARVQKAIRAGEVTVDGIEILDPDYNVTLGNKVSLPEFESEELKPSDIQLKIVFENDDLAVIDKPAGLVVHPGAGNKEDTLSQALLTYFPQIKNVGEPHRPGIVHRLDEDTSGLIVIAKTPEAYEFLKQSFVEKTVQKEYLALVHGVLEKKHGFIDVPLEKLPQKQRMKVGSGKEALTEYFVLTNDPSGQFSLIRVKLHTGRTHQIRAHLAHLNHPIVGDGVYGSQFSNQDRDIKRQFLHAYKLKFQLMDQTWLELESELPTDLKDILNKLEIIYDYKF
jgi:23S rRNA pseudouridine1911/1915/1917 synthase